MPSACHQREWVDPDTPEPACHGQTDHLGRPLELVFSDEFNKPGRTFRDGEDPVWTALANFPSTQSQINAYDDTREYANTYDGVLRLKVSNTPSRQRMVNLTTGEWKETDRPYTSAMLQTWNKFCFTEGVVEISAKLPGKAKQPGLWPAFWLMGNLGRATVETSTEFVWPYAYSQCPKGAEEAAANQEPRSQQVINACLGANWTRRYGLNPGQGRGAVEIDVVEAKPGDKTSDYKRDKVDNGDCAPLTEEQYALLNVSQPSVYTNLIIAPGIPIFADQRPNDTSAGFPANCVPANWEKQWYRDLEQGNERTYGTHFNSTVGQQWGSFFDHQLLDGRRVRFQSDELSAVSGLPESAFEEQHVYRLEWNASGEGYLRFSLDGHFLYQINASTLTNDVEITTAGRPVGELLGRHLPREPMYMILNIDMSTIWNWDDTPCCNDCSDMNCWYCRGGVGAERKWLRELCTTLPAFFEIDYIRVYQLEGAEQTGCSPPEAPTQGWIDEHRQDYYAPYTYEPLEPVYAGGFPCWSSWVCGPGHQGTCVNNVCRCHPGWTGPQCLVKQVGAALECAPLEAQLVGGARCEENTDTCGPHGDCVHVDTFWSHASQGTISLEKGDDGEKKEVVEPAGVPAGRCRCKDGWHGPFCRIEPPGGHASPPQRCVPEASLMAPDLEALIEAVCDRPFFWRREHAASIIETCSQVKWKPWWEPTGGNFSRCGAWPRASAVVAAVHRDTGLCCTRTVGGELDCRETGTAFPFLLGLAAAVLVMMSLVGCLFQAHLRGGLCPGWSGKGRSMRCLRSVKEDSYSSTSTDVEDLQGTSSGGEG